MTFPLCTGGQCRRLSVYEAFGDLRRVRWGEQAREGRDKDSKDDTRDGYASVPALELAAAERAMQWRTGSVVDPVLRGEYPAAMRALLGDRLGRFTATQRAALRAHPVDYVGVALDDGGAYVTAGDR
jgi:hypothetical protein